VGREEVGPGGRVPYLATHQMMLTRDLYEEIGGWGPWFVEHGTDDMDLCFRAFLLGCDCYIEPTALIGHLYRDTFANPVTWGQLMSNYFTTVYLNLGEAKLAELEEQKKDEPGYAEGLAAFEQRRPELERFRRRIVERQRRTGEELLVWLAGGH
jgi:hypothetical protein